MNSIKRKRAFATAGRYGIILFWMLFTLLPLYTAFVASLTEYQNLGKTFLYPTDWAWHNYADVFTRVDMASFLKATFIYAVTASLINVVLATFAAYALSRFRFKGKAFYTCVIFITQVLPQVVIVVPVFMMLQKLGLYNTYAGVIITILATSMAFPILLMRSFFDSVPYALEEAAAIDGCGPVKTFWLIMFPLARPAVMTVTIFNFIAKWNEYFMALIFVNKSELRPVGVGLYATVQSMVVTGDWAGMFASVVIVFLPTVIIYLFLSRQIVAGVTAGGIKG